MSTPSGDSLRDRLTMATLLIGVVALLSRVLGFVRDAVIAAHFGLTLPWDAYNAAIQVPDLLNYLVAGGTLSATFVPLFREYWQQERTSAAWTFFTIISSLMLVLIVALVVLFEIFARPITLLYVGHGGKPDEWVDMVVRITRIILPAQIFFVVGGLVNGVIYSVRGDDKWFLAVPTFGSVIYNMAIIIGGLILSPRVGIEGFAWGGLIGAFIGPFVLVSLAATRAGARFRFRLNLRHPSVRRYLALTLPLMLGISYSFVDQLIATAFGSHLPEGAISALRQAYRLMQVPVGVFGLAAATAAIGTLAGLAAERDVPAFRRQVKEALSRVGVMILPVTVVMIVAAPALVRALLQRGHFDAADTERVASLLRWYSVGMYAWAANYVVSRGLYSLQDTLTPAVLGTLTTLLIVPLSWVLMRALGAEGLALAATIGISLQTLLIFLALRRKLRGLHGPAILRSLWRTVSAAAAAGGVCWGVQRLLHAVPARLVGTVAPASLSLSGSLVEIAVVSAVGFLAFAAIATALGEEEATYLRGRMTGTPRKVRRLWQGVSGRLRKGRGRPQ
ncbi:MAG: murein biosynthesis integral membrane protein MurJ [Armatimonadetes bacterium]|nr:murein biosynthesis integral membrane protein MurJ [Armatimonadota bacterium]